MRTRHYSILGGYQLKLERRILHSAALNDLDRFDQAVRTAMGGRQFFRTGLALGTDLGVLTWSLKMK
jgi:hypothetical protein